MRLLILPLFALLSMLAPAIAGEASDSAAQSIDRCVSVRFEENVADRIGYALKRMKTRDIDIPDGPVTVQPLLAGLRGPSITFLGRDVRLAVVTGQSSPQELWHNGLWNDKRIPCPAASPSSWARSIKRGWSWHGSIDNSIGLTPYEPKILYRSRYVVHAMIRRPYGFVFGGALSVPVSTNTEALLFLPDERAPVRRDLARFANGGGLERLYASWRASPLTDLHLALSAGWLEEMYGGAGAELVFRPFGSVFWAGADGWKVWRRDPERALNIGWTDQTRFTGHLRAGYDMPESRFGVSLAAGRYLAGDFGATVEAAQGFENGGRVSAALTWTNRAEPEGFFSGGHLDPVLRIAWPLGKSRRQDSVTTLRRIGRDGGQMLDRPYPLEAMTETFSAREVIRHWPGMFTP